MDRDDHEVDGEAAPTPLEGFLDEQMKRTPWWVISIVFHGVVLGLLATVTFAKEVVFAEAPMIITLDSHENERIDVQPELKRDLFAKKSLDSDATSDQPQIWAPDFEEGEKNQTANDDPAEEMMGKSYDFQGTIGAEPGVKGRQLSGPPSRTDAMGTGGGGGSSGAFGGRRGGRVNMRARRGGPGTEDVVLAGLKWLARHQGPKGGWSCAGFGGQCAGARCSGGGAEEFDVGVTGLSVLAFLGAGYTHLTKWTYPDPYTKSKMSFGRTVRTGIAWLIEQQDSEGCLGPRQGEFMYNHAIAALALAEAYGLTNVPQYKVPAQKAIDFLVEAQNPGLGWRYTVRPGNNDTSVTGWAVMALKSAKISGLEVPHAAFDGARAWLGRVTDDGGTTGYTALGVTDVFVPGKNDAWVAHRSMTAIGLLLRIYIDSNQHDPMLAKAARQLVEDKPTWSEAKHQIDAYYWYYATLALFQYQDGGGMSFWNQWDEAMKDALCPSQRTRKDGCADGSWPPEVDRWGFAGGRVYLTAMNTMSLEVYYRYQRVFGKHDDADEKGEEKGK